MNVHSGNPEQLWQAYAHSGKKKLKGSGEYPLTWLQHQVLFELKRETFFYQSALSGKGTGQMKELPIIRQCVAVLSSMANGYAYCVPLCNTCCPLRTVH